MDGWVDSRGGNVVLDLVINNVGVIRLYLAGSNTVNIVAVVPCGESAIVDKTAIVGIELMIILLLGSGQLGRENLLLLVLKLLLYLVKKLQLQQEVLLLLFKLELLFKLVLPLLQLVVKDILLLCGRGLVLLLLLLLSVHEIINRIIICWK